MDCPDCGKHLSCIDSRKMPGSMMRRRYECACSKRFSTLEVIIPAGYSSKHISPLQRLQYVAMPGWDKLVEMNDKIAERLFAVCRIKISDEFRQEIMDWLAIAPRTGTEVPETKENENG